MQREIGPATLGIDDYLLSPLAGLAGSDTRIVLYILIFSTAAIALNALIRQKSLVTSALLISWTCIVAISVLLRHFPLTRLIYCETMIPGGDSNRNEFACFLYKNAIYGDSLRVGPYTVFIFMVILSFAWQLFILFSRRFSGARACYDLPFLIIIGALVLYVYTLTLALMV